MKGRVERRALRYPYLSDGAAQTVTAEFGVVRMPQIFVFDRDRRLQYQGRIDDNQREDQVTARDAQSAVDALLAGQAVRLASTRAFGCPVRLLSKAPEVLAEQAQIQAEPVTLRPIGADDLKKLRRNGTNKLVLVNFWAKPTFRHCAGRFWPICRTIRGIQECGRTGPDTEPTGGQRHESDVSQQS